MDEPRAVIHADVSGDGRLTVCEGSEPAYLADVEMVSDPEVLSTRFPTVVIEGGLHPLILLAQSRT